MTGPVLWSWSGEIQPVPLHRHRMAFAGRPGVVSYLPKASKDFREALQTLWLRGRPKEPITGELALTVRFSGKAARGRRPDASNLHKAIEDAMNGFIFVDDSQVRRMDVEIVAWGSDVTPLLEIEVSTWKPRYAGRGDAKL